jgi:hypothetical protein
MIRGRLFAVSLLIAGGPACGLSLTGTHVVDDGGPGLAGSADATAPRPAADGATDVAPGTITADGGSGDPDAGGGPGGNGAALPCGTATCALPAEACCIYRDDKDKFAYACAMAMCPPRKDRSVRTFRCSGQGNCAAGERCCLVKVEDSVYDARCSTASSCSLAQLCDPSAGDAGCPSGDVCAGANIGSWDLPRGYATCGDRSE